MTAEDRLAELSRKDRARQQRHRASLREKGLVPQNVWLSELARENLDRAIASGHFANRSEAINHAIRSVFEETSMT